MVDDDNVIIKAIEPNANDIKYPINPNKDVYCNAFTVGADSVDEQ